MVAVIIHNNIFTYIEYIQIDISTWSKAVRGGGMSAKTTSFVLVALLALGFAPATLGNTNSLRGIDKARIHVATLTSATHYLAT
jgi:hypothetical protein